MHVKGSGDCWNYMQVCHLGSTQVIEETLPNFLKNLIIMEFGLKVTQRVSF